MVGESGAEKIMSSLGKILYFSHKLKLDERTDEELKVMLTKEQNSLYKRFYDITGLSLSQHYNAKIEAIQSAINYNGVLKGRGVK